MRMTTTDTDAPVHVIHNGGAVYVPEDIAEALIRHLDGRSLTATQKATLRSFHELLSLKYNERKHGKCS